MVCWPCLRWTFSSPLLFDSGNYCVGLAPHDAAKSEMTGRGIDRLGVPRRRPVTAAIVRRAQMRAALDHLARDFDVGLTRDRNCLPRRPPRGFSGMQHAFGASASCFGAYQSDVHSQTLPIMSWTPKPFGGNAVTGEVRSKPSGIQILRRKLALPGVGHVLATGREFVAPGEFGAVEAAARGELPFGLGRQVLAGPSRIGQRIGIGRRARPDDCPAR